MIPNDVLAKILSVNIRTLNNYENNKRELGEHKLKILSNFFNVSPAYFFSEQAQDIRIKISIEGLPVEPSINIDK